jgi:hypothetical protein
VTRSSPESDRRRLRLAVFAATVAGLFAWVALHLTFPEAGDAHAYFAADLSHLYGAPEGYPDAYLYSPAFAQAIAPLRWLGWDAFRAVWRGTEIASLAFFTGPLVGLLVFAAPFETEVRLGNINLLIGLAVVAGFRWPATWSFVLLTKITPGVGLLWFLVRREWRSLAIAVGVTLAIAAVSFVAAPGLWFDWIRSTAAQSTPAGVPLVVTAPLPVRIAAAALLVVWGARTDRRWTVLVAACLATPVVAIWTVSMLAGVPFLLNWRWPGFGAAATQAPAG